MVSDTNNRVKCYPARMAQSTALLPHRAHLVRRFGNGDEEKAEDYLLMLGAWLKGHSENTRRTYKVGVKQFFDLFDWVSPEDVTLAHAAAFKEWLLKTKGVSEATAYYRICAVKSFFEFLKRAPRPNGEPMLTYNPFDGLPRNDIQPTPYARSKPMKSETFDKIVAALPTDSVGLRDRAILLFFAFTGRRRTEVSSMRVRDLALDEEPYRYTVRVKGGKLKTFQLPEVCWDAIKAYWVLSGRLRDLRPESGVFTASDRRGIGRDLDPEEPMTPQMMNRILNRAAEDAGVDPSTVTVHGLRHMVARDLSRAGVPIQEIQEFLGHSSPVTTQIYIERLSGPVPSHEATLKKVREQARKIAAEAAGL